MVTSINPIVKTHTCFICGGEKFTCFYTRKGGPYNYNQCVSCGLFISSLAEQSDKRHGQLKSYVEDPVIHDNSTDRSDYSVQRHAVYKKELRALGAYRKLNHLLDIGFGSGDFLLAAKNMQWRVMGTEISSCHVLAARQKGLKVYLGNVTEADMEQESFDVVRMHNVIEHLKDPCGFVQLANKLLRHGGLLLLSTLNTDSYTASFQKDNWKYLDPRYHVHLFNISNLSLLLKKTGFKGKRLRTRGIQSNNQESLRGYVLDNLLNVPAKLLHKGHRMYLEFEKVNSHKL
jgi:2-polyprenyl-3-methyl-5-hydroxy-6-metoxy-1,4-benzoquinol methylase